jgi:RNA polymerase sigma-70 factor (ECF subfamily)
VRRLLAALLNGSAEDMADAEQEILAGLWVGLDRFRFASSFSTFLYRFCRNKAIDLLRRESRHRRRARAAAAAALTGPVAHPADGLEREDRCREVAEALGRLGLEARLLVVMKDVEGMSIQDIAASLGLREGTVKSRLHRSREKLALFLEEGALS